MTRRSLNRDDGLFHGIAFSEATAGARIPKTAGWREEAISGGLICPVNSSFLASAFRDNLQLQVTGYYLNKPVYRRTYTLSTTRATFVTFPNVPVTEVDFYSFGGTANEVYEYTYPMIAADNMTVTILPLPAKSVDLHFPAEPL